MQTPFDNALQLRDLQEAAREYALTHGDAGTPEYRVAWLRFRQRIRSRDELRRWRIAQAKRASRAQAAGARASVSR